MNDLPNPQPEPTPQPTNPNPGALPIEVDPGGLHSAPEVDYGNEPVPPLEPQPDVVPEPEKEEPGPETNPL